MRQGMKTIKIRRKKPACLDWSTDRAVITTLLLAVTFVLLLIGFSGPSVYFTLPGPMGWLYIAIVIIVAAVALVWLLCIEEKRKRENTARLRTFNSRSKRSSFP
jgi:predicted membrane channel-forming protein YqfA (hemolysin III family)